MSDICDKLQTVHARIDAATRQSRRDPHSIQLLAVSKTWPAAAVREAWHCGQRAFGENYVDELIEKARSLADLDIEWHYIGHLQSNKSRAVAEHAHWMHSIDRYRIAQRLSAQRGAVRPPLQVCLQINLSGEASKSGVAPDQALALLHKIRELPNLTLRGLMAIPEPSADFTAQCAAFAQLRELREAANQAGLGLDTLSMGMSGDLEAAVAEGSTLVRIGTAIFGERHAR
ncbi:YggS family pyridoxal phosphate-dependent enzyme [Acidihalobacter ferrooxydans]|uniref:Pyridoxal phosphate homeostasis protein n=1 Tax=Acidihalobacter ferrooxydans TaxID=1765967 RepID=A0A1P8UKD9_9GAMM|nr:YggS family pyridoxal phosphate-dependent enzyme [Acidihalobacter ferrooxydans]APZ44293.1 YggS family pyridoxal phosphate enzyme [Acidihalobacter ferrooxydans]